MSEYTPLTKDAEYDQDEHDAALTETSSEQPHCKRRDTALIYGIVSLLIINVLVWVFASVQLKTIYYAIQENLDWTETRMLSRPEVGNGLEKLLRGT